MAEESMMQASGSGSRPRPSGTQRDVLAIFREKQQLRQKYRKLIQETEGEQIVSMALRKSTYF